MRKLLSFIVALLLCVSLLDAATAYVTGATGEAFSGSTIDSGTLGTASLNDYIVGGVVWFSTTVTLTSITKNTGTGTIETATLVNNPIAHATDSRASMFYAKVTGAGTLLTIRATFSGAPGSMGIVVHRVSGVNTAAPFVGSAMQSQASPLTAANSLTSGTWTGTAAAGDYMFGFFSDVAGGATAFTAGSSPVAYTARDKLTDTLVASESSTAGGSVATGNWGNIGYDSLSGGLGLAAAGGATCTPSLTLIGVGAC